MLVRVVRTLSFAEKVASNVRLTVKHLLLTFTNQGDFLSYEKENFNHRFKR